MLKSLLIPLDSSAYTPVAVHMAAEIVRQAAEFRKEPTLLEGIGIINTETLPKGRFANIVPREKILAEAREIVDKLVEEFRNQAVRLGVDSSQVETHVEEGSPFHHVIHASVMCDLVVVGQKCSFPPGPSDYETLKYLFLRASRPILITPLEFRPVDQVLMMMDGTAPSSRMMYAYSHLNPFPGAKVLLACSSMEESKFPEHAGFFPKVERFLKNRQVDVELTMLEGSLEEELEGLIERVRAPVIAMGIPGEQFVDKLRTPLRIRPTLIEKLLYKTGVSLFTVN